LPTYTSEKIKSTLTSGGFELVKAGYAAGVFTDAGGRLYGMQQDATSP
jgi:hypothetical protein